MVRPYFITPLLGSFFIIGRRRSFTSYRSAVAAGYAQVISPLRLRHIRCAFVSYMVATATEHTPPVLPRRLYRFLRSRHYGVAVVAVIVAHHRRQFHATGNKNASSGWLIAATPGVTPAISRFIEP